MTEGEQSLQSEPLNCDLPGTIYCPPNRSTAPGVLLLHGSGGEPLDDLARGLAADGFTTAAVQYFGGADPVPDHLSEVPIEGVTSAMDTLAAHEATAGEAVGLYGASKGAELALLAAVDSDRVGGVVAISPSCYAWEGLRQDWRPTGTSSWALDDEPVPYVPFTDAQPADDTIRAFYELALERADSETLEAATIRVEHVDAPAMFVSGGDDRMWPSAAFARTAMDRFDDRWDDHPHRHLHYEAAGHVFGPPGDWIDDLDERALAVRGGTRESIRHACEDVWPEVRSFLGDCLDA